jgi:tRNA nucleotidyltransferase (CCA-adding enzyme)
MIEDGVLKELPKERIFEEFKKLLLKSTHPSLGIKLLKKLSGFTFFTEFQKLSQSELESIYTSLDRAASFQLKSDKEKLILMLALLTSQFSKELQHSFLSKLTNQKELFKRVEALTDIRYNLQEQTNFSIYTLATKIDISFYTYYLLALYPKEQKAIKELTQKAKKLHVYDKALPALVEGKDLIKLGLQPSKEFSKILNELYKEQLHGTFHTKKEAIEYLNRGGVFT